MKNVFIINTHHYYANSEGNLSRTLVEMLSKLLEEKGFAVKQTRVDDGYDIQEEIDKHLWADIIIPQIPVNWMGVPWTYKKYMDEIYTAAGPGVFRNGDGRTATTPKKNYGTGGVLVDKKYMLSLTFNAPGEAFNDDAEWFFAGKSEDDLMLPVHLSYKFFGLNPLKTFACYDVMKNPDIDNDLKRLQAHVAEVF